MPLVPALIPEGFALPPLPYLVGLAFGLGALVLVAAHRRPSVDGRHVLALAPWMVTGAVAHVLYVLDALPTGVRPLAGTPAVYATVALLAGALWLGADATGVDAPRTLAVGGTVALVPALAAAIALGSARGTLSPLWPGVGLAIAALVTAGTWAVLVRLRPGVRAAGRVGPLVVFAHALDGVSTALGVDVLQYGERTPLSRLIIEAGRALPTADLLGAGWLFVAVKLAVAGAVVVALADLVDDDPSQGNLLLGLVAAVGLGPGTHNIVLFAVAG
ncbi:MAG: DUF63 family protein [Haloferacaceae archaeon]